MWKRLQQKYWLYVLKKYGCKFLTGPRQLRNNARLIVEAHVDIGRVEINSRDLQIGAHTYIRDGSELLDVSRIGRFCSIGRNVIIGIKAEQHPYSWLSTSTYEKRLFDAHMATLSLADVTIGNDCWIGRDAMIMTGVTIGDGAIIGARSLVNKDVPPYAIVAGSPARILRYRFPEETIRRLEEARWWEASTTYLSNLDFSDPIACLERLNVDRAEPAHYPLIEIRRSGISLLSN